MTNEELVAHIQADELDWFPVLWEQVERFVAKEASRAARKLRPGNGVTFEDLYQSGYLAMVAAAKSYDTGRGMSFIGYLAFHLKLAFAEAGGWRGGKRDPILEAVSLSAPLGAGEDDRTLEDMVADPKDDYADVEADMCFHQLRNILGEALGQLPDGGGELLRQRYLQGITLADLAERTGCTSETVRQRELKAIRELKRTHYAPRLYSFIEDRTDYFRHVGVNRFNTAYTSVVEALVQRREELAEAFNKRHKLERG